MNIQAFRDNVFERGVLFLLLLLSREKCFAAAVICESFANIYISAYTYMLHDRLLNIRLALRSLVVGEALRIGQDFVLRCPLTKYEITLGLRGGRKKWICVWSRVEPNFYALSLPRICVAYFRLKSRSSLIPSLSSLFIRISLTKTSIAFYRPSASISIRLRRCDKRFPARSLYILIIIFFIVVFSVFVRVSQLSV